MHPDLITDFRAAKRAAAQLASVIGAEIIQRGATKILRLPGGTERVCSTWLEVYGYCAAIRTDQIPRARELTAADLAGRRVLIRSGKLAGQTVTVDGPCPQQPGTRAAVRTVDGQRWSVALERLTEGSTSR